MLAAHTVCKGIGSQIIVSDIPSPALKSKQVLIAARASSINPLDFKLYRALRYLPLRNIVLGHDVAGVITDVGAGVTDFNVGDEVYGCLPGAIGGAFAETVRAPASAIALKPKNLTMEQAAATPLVALTAWQAIHKAGLKPGDSLLVIGASGGVGTFAVQLAKALGIHVTGVCGTNNVAMVQSLGADDVIDYKKESIFDRPQQYQMVFDVVGQTNLHRCKKLLSPNGHYLAINPGPRNALDFISGKRHARVIFMRPSQPDLNAITQLIEAGKVKPVIDKEFALAEIAQAYEYAEKQKGSGKVVVNLG